MAEGLTFLGAVHKLMNDKPLVLWRERCGQFTKTIAKGAEDGETAGSNIGGQRRVAAGI